MHDVKEVCMGERVGDLHRVAEHIARWQRAPSEPVIERFALEILHHKVRPAVLIAYIEQRADVWVTEGGDRARLGLEPRTAIRPFGQFRVQQFDRNRSLQSRIPRLVDLAHPADTDERQDFVRTQFRAPSQCHRTFKRAIENP
jgi:hypothetical protein